MHIGGSIPPKFFLVALFLLWTIVTIKPQSITMDSLNNHLNSEEFLQHVIRHRRNLLLVFAVLLIFFSLPSLLILRHENDVINALGIASGLLGVITGALIISGVLMGSKSSLVAAYYSSVFIFLIVLAFIILEVVRWTTKERQTTSNEKVKSSWTFRRILTVIGQVIGLLFSLVTPLVIRRYVAVEYPDYQFPYGMKDIATCKPCRKGRNGGNNRSLTGNLTSLQ